jgi:hypothetical protein
MVLAGRAACGWLTHARRTAFLKTCSLEVLMSISIENDVLTVLPVAFEELLRDLVSE